MFALDPHNHKFSKILTKTAGKWTYIENDLKSVNWYLVLISEVIINDNFCFIYQRKSDLKTVQEEDEVYDGEETIDYWFYVNRWFASDEDDKQIIRELIPTDKDGKPLRKALDGRKFK